MGRAEMDRRIGRFFFASSLPFNVARSPYWKDVVTGLANCSLSGYVPPTSEKLRTIILAEEKANIEKLLEKKKFSWKQYGVSIVSDGWTDIQGRPLINFIAYSLDGPIFLKCVDASGEYKNAEYLKGLFIEVIKEVGEDNVVQIITDNALVCQRAGMNLASDPKYSHIFWTPCVAHSINLALKSICNPSKDDPNAGFLCSWIEELEHDVKNIRNFVVNHNNALSIFDRHSDLKLLKVAETRFASIIVMIKRIKQVKHALTLMVTDNDWEFYRNDDIVKAQEIKKCILEDEWWDKVTYFLQFTEPIWQMLREVDKEGLMLHKVYDMWDKMIEKIQNIIFRHEKKNVALDDSKFFDHVHRILVRRWNRSNNPLHCMAHSLNPKYYGQTWLAGGIGRVPPNRDPEISKNREICLGRLYFDSHRLKIINNEFASFSGGRNDSIQAAMARDEKDPVNWWLCFGASTLNLQHLALKLLSQPATSSCCERNWSTYSQIHNIKRNKLTSKRAEDLVYVHCNLRLLSRTSNDYSSGSSKYWDVNPEDVDVELEGEHELHALNMDLTEPVVLSNLDDATEE
ncbi:uncharacterized protein LOC126410608 [Nymphaea colorata]|nr:uncharacterized protein LOC126410608 [Nymphaea colorata]